MSRQSWDQYFCSIATVVASRSTCPRLSVGAVLVKDRRIISTGYNGSGSGQSHCVDKGCLMHDGSCIRPIHAEVNALLQLAKIGNSDGAAYSTMYVTHSPCLNCFKLMYQAGVKRIVYVEDYKLADYQTLLDINNNCMPTIVKLAEDTNVEFTNNEDNATRAVVKAPKPAPTTIPGPGVVRKYP